MTCFCCCLVQVTIDGIKNSAPFRTHGVEVTQYGAVMHQLKVEELGYLVAFTPQSNEFTIQLSPTMVNNRTSGLCGMFLLDPDTHLFFIPFMYCAIWTFKILLVLFLEHTASYNLIRMHLCSSFC